MSDPEKPRIYTSCFCCETVIRDKRDLLTAVRIADGFVAHPIILYPRPAQGDTEVDATLLFPPLKFAVVLIFRAEQPVEFEVDLKAVTPGGRVMNTSKESLRVNITEARFPHVMNIDLNLNVEEEGDYEFNLYVDGVISNKMRLRIAHDTKPPQPLQDSTPDPSTAYR